MMIAPDDKPLGYFVRSIRTGRALIGHPAYFGVPFAPEGYEVVPVYERVTGPEIVSVEDIARAIMSAKGACRVKDWPSEERDNPHVELALKQARAVFELIHMFPADRARQRGYAP